MTDEMKRVSVPAATLNELRLKVDTLTAIARRLDGAEWTADTTAEIAELVRAAGYTVRNPRQYLDEHGAGE